MPASPPRSHTLLAVAVAAVAAAVALPAVPGQAARTTPRACGLVRANGRLYQAQETHGTVPCRRVRRVVGEFLNRGRAPRGWHCFDNNASSGQAVAASCARGGSVVVRIYAPT